MNVKLFELISKRYSFDPKYWKDCGTFWLNIAPQGTNEWYYHRSYRLTASNFGAAIGKSKFCSPMDIALDIANIQPRTFSDKSKFVMQHGVVTEPKAREWYSNKYKVQVKEIGLAVPKWEVRIGGSIDGEVGTDGMIEIKSPLKMYEPLKKHIEKINSGWRPPPFYHQHIWETHYAQMQGCMKIINKKWCDYIVYATDSNQSYVERIYFNESYWDKVLWPGIQHFLNNILEPLLNKN